MEQKIIAAIIASSEAFRLAELASIKKEFSDKGELIYDEIAEYYSIDKEAPKADVDLIVDRLVKKYPKHVELFKAALTSLPEISVENMKDYIIGLRRTKIKTRLAAMFSSEGNDDAIKDLLETYYDTLDELGDEPVQEAQVFHNPTLDELINKVNHNAKIKLSPAILNDVTDGGVLRKHHILVFGRPDIGKSTHAVEFVYGFLRQGCTVLYISNEDPPEELIVRCISRLTGMTRKQIVESPQEAQELMRKRNFDKLIFVEMTPGTPDEIKKVVEEYRPDVLIIDQVRNLNMKEVNGVVQLEKAERFIRNLGKQYNMVTISFTQAGESAHNKLFLEMTDIDGSKTGMQASADLMIGIGANEDYILNNQRSLCFPKNKLTGDKQPRRVSVDFSTYKVV